MDRKVIKDIISDAGFADVAFVSTAPFEGYREATRGNLRAMFSDPLEAAPWARSLMVLALPLALFDDYPARVPRISAYYLKSHIAFFKRDEITRRFAMCGARVEGDLRLPEKPAAYRAGWRQGRNGLAMHPLYGGMMALSVYATDIPLEAGDVTGDERLEDTLADACKGCERCVCACPTGALKGCGWLNWSRCLRAFMLNGSIVPEELRALMGSRLLGCDDCMAICPANIRAQRHLAETGVSVAPPEGLAPLLDLRHILAGDTRGLGPLIGDNYARPQRAMIQASLVAGNMGRRDLLGLLEELSANDNEALAEHARWSVRQLK